MDISLEDERTNRTGFSEDNRTSPKIAERSKEQMWVFIMLIIFLQVAFVLNADGESFPTR